MGIRLIKISVVYFSVGVLLGLYMSIASNYIYKGVHVHINLLGWTSLTLAGLIYLLFPKAAETVFAKVHFWIHNIALPIMMVGLFLYIAGYEAFFVMIPVGGTAVVIGILIFAYNIIKNVDMSDFIFNRK